MSSFCDEVENAEVLEEVQVSVLLKTAIRQFGESEKPVLTQAVGVSSRARRGNVAGSRPLSSLPC